MFRITRRGQKSRRPDVSTRSGAIRVARKSLRPVRIATPGDGAVIHGFATVIKGSANPGDTLKLECSGIEPIKCRVKNDGSWAIPDVRLPTGSQELTVVDENNPELSATIRILVSEVTPIYVTSPLTGETLEAKHIEVTGKAARGRLVCLRLGRKTMTERANNHGSFRFSDVELPEWGDQRLMFYYAEAPAQGNTDITVRWPGLDLPSIVDPVTRSHLEPGADIVRCINCYTYCYRATWVQVGRCPRCDVSNKYWNRASTDFHTPRINLTN